MPTPSLNPDTTASTAPQTAAMQIVRFRGALDWMLAHPDWEDCLACSLNELGLKGQRQGINLRSALRALPIEQKQELVRHALEQGLPRIGLQDAKRFARHWGVTQYRSRHDFAPPSHKQWSSLQQQALLRVSARYESYKKAQRELFSTFQQLPLHCALSNCRNPSQREDACQEARLALLEAIDRIDPNENFEAYARQWIKRRILNFLMKERIPVKAPINLISKTFRESHETNSTLERAIREGTVSLDDSSRTEAQLDPELSTEADHAPDEVACASDESAIVSYALNGLTAKQREVVELRFGLGEAADSQTLAQIAQRTGISRQQVFQREKRALQALRTSLGQIEPERRTASPRASSY